ncbi:hypothetical protein Tco_1084653 [Tanacetum coccineum]
MEIHPRTNRLSTIFRHLSHKLFRKLLPFVDLYSGDIVSRNILTLRIPSPLVIVIVVMVAVVGSWSGPKMCYLTNRTRPVGESDEEMEMVVILWWRRWGGCRGGMVMVVAAAAAVDGGGVVDDGAWRHVGEWI